MNTRSPFNALIFVLIFASIIVGISIYGTNWFKPPDYEGQIVEKTAARNNSVLLLVHKPQDSIELIWICSIDGTEFSKLKVGQIIAVWSNSVLRHSNPPQTDASKIVIR